MKRFFAIATLVLLAGLFASCSRIGEREHGRLYEIPQRSARAETRSARRSAAYGNNFAYNDYACNDSICNDSICHDYPCNDSAYSGQQRETSDFSRRNTTFPTQRYNGYTTSNLPSYYETEYATSETDRSTNLRLAAAAINQTIVPAGEIFSFNKTIGSTTDCRGYKECTIFADGVITKGYGGGVCQVASTLCNAAHTAGMAIIERHDHSLPVTYIKDGLQAATSHNGGLDFRFKNEFSYDVVIIAKAENGRVSVRIDRA